MKDVKGKVGMRELIALILLMIGTKLSDDTPSLLFDKVKNAAWMVPILSGAIMAIPTYLLLKTMSLYKNKNLIDVMKDLFGKYITFFLCFMLFIVAVYEVTTDTRNYVNIISTMYFTNTPPLIIYTILMVICAYGAKRGIQHISSVAWMMIYYIKAMLLLVFILAMQDSTLAAVFPFWGTGKLAVLKESSLNLTLFADILFLALLLPYMSSQKEFKKGTWIAYVITGVEISVALLLYELMFDYESVSTISYPFHEVIRYISLGRFFTNIETLFFPIWLVAMFIRFAAYLYICAIIFGQLFKIKDFEYIIPSLAAVFLLIGMYPQSPAFTTFVLRENLHTYSSPLMVILPIFIWLVALIKGEFRHGQKKNSM
jgi:spore germination protein KB